VAQAAAERFRRELGVNVVGVDEAFLRDAESAEQRAPLLQRIKQARADLVLVAFGAPKQELFADHARRALPTAVFVGVGATFDFIAGRVRRAPRWMQRAGLEWFYRLSREPRRLWRRYLVRDPKFVALVLRQWLQRGRYLQAGTPPSAA
jgi:N-acetylglucosaminyldiphosphoundecaprenol N-acetyl-beta-D-mannosaminyltransferase